MYCQESITKDEIQKLYGSKAWWLEPLLPELVYLRQKDHQKFKASLDYKVRLS